MKFVGIVRSRSTLGEIVLKMDEPVSDAAYEYARRSLRNKEERKKFVYDEMLGELTVKTKSLSPKLIARWEKTFTDAQKAIKADKDTAEKEHQRFLQRASEDSKLPLV
jgi:hypothetical protein